MGTWGPGVFQNDHALDLYGIVTDKMKNELEHVLNLEPVSWDDIEGPLVYVHLLGVLAKECEPVLRRSAVAGWKTRYLAIYDGSLGDEAIGPRREVIVKTFDALLERLPPDAATPPPKAAAKKPKAAAKKPKAAPKKK